MKADPVDTLLSFLLLFYFYFFWLGLAFHPGRVFGTVGLDLGYMRPRPVDIERLRLPSTRWGWGSTLDGDSSWDYLMGWIGSPVLWGMLSMGYLDSTRPDSTCEFATRIPSSRRLFFIEMTDFQCDANQTWPSTILLDGEITDLDHE